LQLASGGIGDHGQRGGDVLAAFECDGEAVASAATITPTGNVFHVTGTTNIDNVTIMGAGTTITIIFDGVLTVGDGTGNLKLTAGFTTSADDTLTLASDGTNWLEVARAVN
jgi:hypothetical protein